MSERIENVDSVGLACVRRGVEFVAVPESDAVDVAVEVSGTTRMTAY